MHPLLQQPRLPHSGQGKASSEYIDKRLNWALLRPDQTLVYRHAGLHLRKQQESGMPNMLGRSPRMTYT